MQEQFFFETDQQTQSTSTGKVNDTIALYSSPLQRMRNFGAEALTEIDALSLLLDAHYAVLAGELLTEFGSLTGLSRASVANLRRFLPETKAAQLAAALRLATLLSQHSLLQEPLDTPEPVYALYGAEMRSCDREVLTVVLLNTRFGLIKCERISQGTINETIAHPRDIFRPAIIHSAYAFVLIHNHPSGDVAPSDTDLRLTRRVSDVSRLIDIKMLDHVIMGTPAEGRSGYFSFKEAGLL
jgi:DNA repair protein RadC